MPFLDKIGLPNGRQGYFRPIKQFAVSDPDYVKWAMGRLEKEPAVRDQWDLHTKETERVYKLAGLADFRPTMRFPIPGAGLGVAGQMPPIANRILPQFVSGPDAQGYYPIAHKEHLYVDPEGNKVGPLGTVKRLDVRIEFGTATTNTYAIEVQTEPDETAAATKVLELNIDTFKLDRAQSAAATEEESVLAASILDTSNYATGYSETLTGTKQWTHPDSEPLNAFWAQRRVLTAAVLSDPDVFGMGGDTEAILQINKQIMYLASRAGTGTRAPSTPVNRDFLAALFQCEIAVGNMAKVADLSSATVTHSQIWSDFAGLYCTGLAEPFSPRFGLNLVREGYPTLTPYWDQKAGTKGAFVQKWAYSFAPVITLNTAGYLWLDTKN